MTHIDKESAVLFINVFIVVSCVKSLLLNAYHSTDFECHRNWLAITHSLPINKWYVESTSEWTLDYPPLFAWFEYLLGNVAVFFDPEMLKVDNLNYKSLNTLIFQKLSVIITDIVYAYGVYRCVNKLLGRCLSIGHQYASTNLALLVIMVCDAGLLIVDHIHFQYNGFLFGVFLISLSYVAESSFGMAALWFSILLNLKHIYLYYAPAYGIYFLRRLLLNRKKSMKNNILATAKVGFIVLAVFGISLGPFIWLDQIQSMLARLFPFKRGLSHAYWAPNFWALYNFLDKVLFVSGKALQLNVNASTATMTGGLVQEFSHTVLPSVSPLATFLLTSLSLVPALIKLWCNPTPAYFLKTVIICGFSSFMFGWHVHEKAILMVTIPLALLSMLSRKVASMYLFLDVISIYSLFPLLFQSFETLIKIPLLLLHFIGSWLFFRKIHASRNSQALPFSLLEKLYLLTLMTAFLYQEFFHFVLQHNAYLPFLPLLMYSVMSAVGVAYTYLRFYRYVLFHAEDCVSETPKKVQ